MLNSISPIVYAPMPQITAQDISNMYGPQVYQENLGKIYVAENELKLLQEPSTGYNYVFNKYKNNNAYKELSNNKFFKYNTSELIEIIQNIEIKKYQAAINYTKATPGYYNHTEDAMAHIDIPAILMRLNNVLNNQNLDMETKEYIITRVKDGNFCNYLTSLDNIDENDITSIKNVIYPNRTRLPYYT